MRGKVTNLSTTLLTVRITPAYAGKSSNDLHNCCNCQDHPRLCGEKILSQETSSEDIGSPPPMRGKAEKPDSGQQKHRITPAYAGKSCYSLQYKHSY